MIKNKIRKGLDDNSNRCHTYPLKKRKGKEILVVSVSGVKSLYLIIETYCIRKIDTLPCGLNVPNGLGGGRGGA